MNNSGTQVGDLVYKHFGPEGGSKLKFILEFLIYFVGFLGILAALPVAYSIWTARDASDVSLVSWIALASFTPFWILYGWLHKKPSLVMTYVVWLISALLVVFGVLMFG